MTNKRTWLTQFLLILEVTNPAYENLSLDIDERSVLVLHKGLAPHGPQAIVQKTMIDFSAQTTCVIMTMVIDIWICKEWSIYH